MLIAGIRISGEFDDNALNDNRNKQPNLMTVIEPHVTWKLARSRLEWLLHYSNGISTSQQLPAYKSQSHLLDVRLGFQPTRHLRLAFSNSFLNSTNPFDFLRADGAIPGVGQPHQLNDSLLTATANRTSEQAAAEASYALSLHGTVGANGSFLSLRYRAPTANQLPLQFKDESSVGGGIFYSQHFMRRQWARVDYGIQRMVFRGRSSLVHNVFYTHTISLSSTAALSVFAGPEFATASNTLNMVHPSSASPITWRWAGGATYNWRAPGTHLALGFCRKISSESGLLGAAWLSSATAELHRRITPRWTADLAGAYDHNKMLDAPQNVLSFVWAAAGLTRALSRDMTVEFKYWRVHQATDTLGAGRAAADHNRVSVSLGYDFKSRPGK